MRKITLGEAIAIIMAICVCVTLAIVLLGPMLAYDCANCTKTIRTGLLP